MRESEALYVVQLKADLERACTIAVALEQQVARVEALADEWEAEGREAEGYINRAHSSEIHEVMTEARIFPRIAKEVRDALGDDS